MRCIGSKVGHQVASLDCHIPLNCPIGIISWYLHQPESHQLSLNKVTDGRTSGPNNRTPGLPGSDKKLYCKIWTSKQGFLTMKMIQKGLFRVCFHPITMLNICTTGPNWLFGSYLVNSGPSNLIFDRLWGFSFNFAN